MAVSRQEDLRANQKARTRTALVEAAAELMRAGAPPSVPEAAERAKVSRATAYRYFPTQESLLTEVATKQNVEPEEQMLASLDTDDVEERLRRLFATFTPIVLEDELHMRTALRVFQDQWLGNRRNGIDTPVREGRRMRWLDEVLAPLRGQQSPQQERRLRAALSLTMSIEPIIVLHDVCHIDDSEEVLDILQWAATALLHAALDEPKARPRSRR